MIRRRSGMFVMLGAFALVAATLATTTDLWLFRLPNPEHADREGLFRWLVTRDLVDETPDVRSKLIVRLEAELEAGIALQSVSAELKPEYREQLGRNIELLLSDWFRLQAARYESEPRANRQTLLDGQIDAVERWGLLDYLLAQDAASAQKSQLERLMQFDRRVQPWIAQAPLEEQEQLRQYVVAVESRLMARHLRSLW